MKASAIVLAAGEGKRLGMPIPKAFAGLGDKPLVVHSLEKFFRQPFVREIVLTVPRGYVDRIDDELGPYLQRVKVLKVVEGGARRQDSVENALRAVDPESDVIIIHDSARPLVTDATIRKVAETAARRGACICAGPAVDTVKIAPDGRTVRRTIDRDEVWLAHTPQAFRRRLLERAIANAKKKKIKVTDDSSLVEALGEKVWIVPSEGPNLKITSKDDLIVGEMLLKRSRS